MPGFVITSVFEMDGGKHPLGSDVLAGSWGMGHRFSYCDGRMLTLVVELTAIDVAAAFEAVLSRAEMVWQGLGYGTLGPAVTMRVQGAVEPAQVPAGIPPAVPDEAGRGKRRKIARVLRYGSADVDLDGLTAELRKPPNDEPPDDGGLAGMREPRRPKPAPPGLHLGRDLPDAVGM